jgi:RimJ/RimL family protein N-acetyltransferase
MVQSQGRRVSLIESKRLTLRRLEFGDAEFILGLLNQESFIRHIGDKGVRDLAGARDYIAKGPIESYRRFGFGLYLTSLREAGLPIGICGLVKREALEDVDIGFAFLPQYGRMGYATESAAAVLDYGKRVLGLQRIVGIVSPENLASIAVLEKIGLQFEGMVTLAPDARALMLFGPGGATSRADAPLKRI